MIGRHIHGLAGHGSIHCHVGVFGKQDGVRRHLDRRSGDRDLGTIADEWGLCARPWWLAEEFKDGYCVPVVLESEERLKWQSGLVFDSKAGRKGFRSESDATLEVKVDARGKSKIGKTVGDLIIPRSEKALFVGFRV